jgi:hypothetical protein
MFTIFFLVVLFSPPPFLLPKKSKGVLKWESGSPGTSALGVPRRAERCLCHTKHPSGWNEGTKVMLDKVMLDCGSVPPD